MYYKCVEVCAIFSVYQKLDHFREVGFRLVSNRFCRAPSQCINVPIPLRKNLLRVKELTI